MIDWGVGERRLGGEYCILYILDLAPFAVYLFSRSIRPCASTIAFRLQRLEMRLSRCNLTRSLCPICGGFIFSPTTLYKRIHLREHNVVPSQRDLHNYVIGTPVRACYPTNRLPRLSLPSPFSRVPYHISASSTTTPLYTSQKTLEPLACR